MLTFIIGLFLCCAMSRPVNVAMDQAIQVLSSIQSKFSHLSYADLIVLAGNTAIEEASGKALKFCGGRVDATDGAGSDDLKPWDYNETVLDLNFTIQGIQSNLTQGVLAVQTDMQVGGWGGGGWEGSGLGGRV